MEKLTPKLAQKIQDDILYNMLPKKKIRLTSQLYLLLKKIQDSKTISKNGTRRTVKKHN